MEISSPDAATAGSGYRLKFTPPFRSTLRPPQRNLQLTPRTLNNFRKDLGSLFAAANTRAAAPAAAKADQDIIKKIRNYGTQLYANVAPPNVQDELNPKDLYLELGVDEPLIELAWELLHDGSDFLCLKHRVARFVNVARENPPAGSPPDPWTEGPLSVLIVSVPIPQQRNGRQFEFLTSAQKETDAIIRTIDSLGVAVTKKALIGKEATVDNVWEELYQSGHRYHIVHFSGHAFFDPASPTNSSLMLFDEDMDAAQIMTSFGRKPPVLCFMNGCETAVMPGAGDETQNRFDVFSLARAILDTGSYFIGNRWRVNDAAAATFAETFYRKLLIDGQSLGQVIRDARIECKKQLPEDDFSWASYIYYGDPRLYFRKL
jgi:CHAT domain-containing protein